MKIFEIPKKSGRMLILSDCHLDHFDGVAGYSSEKRMEFLRDALLLQKDFDGVIFAGDMISRNLVQPFSVGSLLPMECVHRWRRMVIQPLTAAGIPAFVINASHDSLTADEFASEFGYPHHFALIHGDTAFLCLDTYAGERDGTLQTTASDIPDEIVGQCENLLARDEIRAAFLVCHWPNPGENLASLTAHAKVLAVIAGHTHDNTIVSLRRAGVESEKLVLQTGHFSRAHTKRVADGCGFKPFVPMTDGDFSRTGSPWQYRAVQRTATGIESYQIFPAMHYGGFTSDGIDFPAFDQPYAEGYGDRSFIKFTIS